MKKNTGKLARGFMMVEILVAAAIITGAVLAAMAVTEKTVYLSRQSFHATQAAFLLEEGAEAVRILRDNGWVNIAALAPGTPYYPAFQAGVWTLSATPSATGIFVRTVRVENVKRDDTTKDIALSGTTDPGAKLVTVTVSWTEGGAVVAKQLQLYLMDIFS